MITRLALTVVFAGTLGLGAACDVDMTDDQSVTATLEVATEDGTIVRAQFTGARSSAEGFRAAAETALLADDLDAGRGVFAISLPDEDLQGLVLSSAFADAEIIDMVDELADAHSVVALGGTSLALDTAPGGSTSKRDCQKGCAAKKATFYLLCQSIWPWGSYCEDAANTNYTKCAAKCDASGWR